MSKNDLCDRERQLKREKELADAIEVLTRNRPANSMPRGCVCPPGAEATCQGFACPRKPLTIT
jgi:hypothetical protein